MQFITPRWQSIAPLPRKKKRVGAIKLPRRFGRVAPTGPDTNRSKRTKFKIKSQRASDQMCEFEKPHVPDPKSMSRWRRLFLHPFAVVVLALALAVDGAVVVAAVVVSVDEIVLVTCDCGFRGWDRGWDCGCDCGSDSGWGCGCCDYDCHCCCCYCCTCPKQQDGVLVRRRIFTGIAVRVRGFLNRSQAKAGVKMIHPATKIPDAPALPWRPSNCTAPGVSKPGFLDYNSNCKLTPI